jgi:hypothetical protein
LGVSRLDVSPRAPYSPLGTTEVWSGFALTELSAPFWFGSWVLAPSARARLFVAERRVTLDGRTELAVPAVAPGFGVHLGYAFE